MFVRVRDVHCSAQLEGEHPDRSAFSAAASRAEWGDVMNAVCSVDDDVTLGQRLPLALDITAALLRIHPAVNLDELANELSYGRSALEGLYPDDARPAESSVRVTLELAYRGLAETAAQAFRLLSVNPGPDLCTGAIATLANVPVSETDRILISLTRACLIEPVPGGAGRWRMNELVRSYARRLSDLHADSDRREQGRDRLLGYYLDTTAAAEHHLRMPPRADPAKDFTGREHALAWLDAERGNLIAAVQMAADTGRDRTAIKLPLLLADYLAYRGDFDDLMTTTIVSLTTAQRLGDQDAEGNALTNLGGALLEMRRLEKAVTTLRDAVAIFQQTGGGRRREGDALNNLGVALTATGQPGEAVAAHEDAAAIFRKTGDQHREAKALNNLGVALTATGRLGEAIIAHHDAAAIFRKTGDQHREAKALNNLKEARQQLDSERSFDGPDSQHNL
jgi:tetratricopeptide (TPR) repeat protein